MAKSLARTLADAVSVGELTATATIKMWGKSTIPDGWLECDGAAVSRSTYSDLFAEIGTTFGIGDGSTTFNLPDLQDNVPVGKSANKALGTKGGNATVTPNVTKSGSAAGSLNGAPDAGNLAVSVSGNISNTTLSENQMPAHRHGTPAQYANQGMPRGEANRGWQSSWSGSTGWDALNPANSATDTTGASAAHSHSHSLSGSMTGVPGLGNLGVTINDNIAVSADPVSTEQPYQAVTFIIKT